VAVCGTIAGPEAGKTAGAALPVTIGGGTAAGATALACVAATARGPEGNSESNPLPSARRFSAGLCSSIAAIVSPISGKYVVVRYISRIPFVVAVGRSSLVLGQKQQHLSPQTND
jgi:hypothetical protein